MGQTPPHAGPPTAREAAPHLGLVSDPARSPNLNWSRSWSWSWKDWKGPTAVEERGGRREEEMRKEGGEGTQREMGR